MRRNAWGEPAIPNPVYAIIATRTAQVAIPATLSLAILARRMPPRTMAVLTAAGGLSVGALLTAYFVATFSAKFTIPGSNPLERLPNCAGNSIALTFDDGPHPETTPALLETLARANARATFFLVAKRAAQYPDLARQIHASGHSIGIHGLKHRAMVLQSAREIRRDLQTARTQIEQAIGSPLPRPLLLRPPYGFKTWTLCRTARDMGFQLISWSLDPRDYDPIDVTTMQRKIAEQIRPGEIILLHERPGSNNTLLALPDILTICARHALAPIPITLPLP